MIIIITWLCNGRYEAAERRRDVLSGNRRIADPLVQILQKKYSMLSAGLLLKPGSTHGLLLKPGSTHVPRAGVPIAAYGVDVPYKEAQYDPAAAETFFKAKPLDSLGRLAQLTSLSGGFIFNALMDKKNGREEEMVDQRSEELLELVTKMGPTFIKVGQALSIRTDLLPAPYVAGLVGLQDSVAPFSGAEGRRIIEEELGIDIDRVFSKISSEPVASASIGQVYRATLRETGEDVAIKVQRPRVLRDVALDLFMMRSLAPVWSKAQDSNTDLVALVDAWGSGFINELDYRKEAAATTAFSEAMRQRGLGSVFAPEVVDSLSSMHVLTTKWVDGERLASSAADDVPRLCGVALNAYLTMLLDTGVLHCDPHPGTHLLASCNETLAPCYAACYAACHVEADVI